MIPTMRHDYGKTTACRRLNGLRINSFGAGLSILVAAAVTLSACGIDNKADNNVTGGSPPPRTSAANVYCGGRPTLKASGSTAQENAMTAL
jgi:phosphate transport system substrate-binding protein